jgi:hypothetical protein
MALTGAICCMIHAFTGFTNQSLRGFVARPLGRDYTTNQMTYDLRRLRLHGPIQRLPGTNTHTVTPEGLRVAVFYTKSTASSSAPSSKPTNLRLPPNCAAP